MRCSFGRSLLALTLLCVISQAVHAETIADSAADWSIDGVQGENSWFNGYYNLTLDEEEGDGQYQPDDFITFLNDDSLEVLEDNLNQWDGNAWRLYRDTPDTVGQDTGPWTTINQNGGHPNGTNSAAPILVDEPRQDEHWSVRRWVSSHDGEATLISTVQDSNPNCGGNGTSVELYHNGNLVNKLTAPGGSNQVITNAIGVTLATDDVLDFALTPEGTDGGRGDGCDGSNFSLVVTDDPPPPPPRTALADSVADWSTTGTQGEKNWFNGYYNLTDDPDGDYQTDDFMAFTNSEGPAGGPVEPDGNHWDGDKWDLDSQGDPGPWTELGRQATHPNGTNSAPNAEHWTIRRFVASDLAGPAPLELNWQMAKTNLNGDGVTGVLMVNGEQVDSATIAGGNGNGVNRSFYVNANPNDIIELALTPVGTTNDGDGADGSSNQLTIHDELPDGPLFNPGEVMADSIAEFSGEQGQDGWFYGLYDQRADVEDGDGVYSVDEFEPLLNDGSDFIWDDPPTWRESENHWDGAKWDIVDNPLVSTGPWTEVTAAGGHPAANSQGDPEVHWAIRRWVSDVDGEFGILGLLNNVSANGDGTVGRIFLDGQEIWSEVSNGDVVDINVTVQLTQDSVLDFVIDSDGAGNFDPNDPFTIDDIADGNDGTNFSFQILELIPFIPGGGLGGDYNEDGAVDVLDIDLQAVAMKEPAPDLDKFDENGDGLVNYDDRLIWVKDHRKTWVGDANLDDEFNSGDLVAVFAAGKYETGLMAGWAEGDWNGDMEFGSSDLVAAFSDGGYELGPQAAPAVPEPSSLTLLALAGLWMVRRRRRRA